MLLNASCDARIAPGLKRCNKYGRLSYGHVELCYRIYVDTLFVLVVTNEFATKN